MAYLDPKGEGDNSMPEHLRPCPGALGGAPRRRRRQVGARDGSRVNSAAWVVGTIALATMTLGAVVTTIVITAQDRRRAQERIGEEHRGEQLSEAYLVRVLHEGKPTAGRTKDRG